MGKSYSVETGLFMDWKLQTDLLHVTFQLVHPVIGITIILVSECFFFAQQQLKFKWHSSCMSTVKCSKFLLKVNESQYIALLVVSGSIGKLFFAKMVKDWTICFSQFHFSGLFYFSCIELWMLSNLSVDNFFNRFCPTEKCGIYESLIW